MREGKTDVPGKSDADDARQSLVLFILTGSLSNKNRRFHLAKAIYMQGLCYQILTPDIEDR